MSSVAVFFVFLLIMLALATLAIILDWMGKPIRRSFRPRTTGTPAWVMVDAPVPPESPDTSTMPSAGRDLLELPAESAAIEQPEAASEPSAEYPALNPAPQPEEPSSSGPWQAGDSIFKLTPRGTPPSITAVRRRYWKNLSERPSSAVFGEDNRTLMAVGQAPQRFNPRNGAIEELSLPESMLRYCWAAKRRPTPTWDDQGLDPFARP
ncbi:MAG: hypothetical protein F4124_14555 [Acidimicrobiia bacterium]|nr:hypothetical protein [bacterium]MXW57951.1 hypothetical protein [Acidimicrobiia bacterium]MYB08465.1 hypothetical protein [Acidimicrobiia bacterium]MYB72404.1 hypothetical protein [Acidimicrobiia bacterium]MYG59586.1 hypothetical protein [Acidimicrobiia bacterium]